MTAAPFIYRKEETFEEILSGAMEKLEDSQVRFSLRRIDELDLRAAQLEHELDEFLLSTGTAV
jgi:hypothetical protein